MKVVRFHILRCISDSKDPSAVNVTFWKTGLHQISIQGWIFGRLFEEAFVVVKAPPAPSEWFPPVQNPWENNFFCRSRPSLQIISLLPLMSVTGLHPLVVFPYPSPCLLLVHQPLATPWSQSIALLLAAPTLLCCLTACLLCSCGWRQPRQLGVLRASQRFWSPQTQPHLELGFCQHQDGPHAGVWQMRLTGHQTSHQLHVLQCACSHCSRSHQSRQWTSPRLHTACKHPGIGLLPSGVWDPHLLLVLTSRAGNQVVCRDHQLQLD